MSIFKEKDDYIEKAFEELFEEEESDEEDDLDLKQPTPPPPPPPDPPAPIEINEDAERHEDPDQIVTISSDEEDNLNVNCNSASIESIEILDSPPTSPVPASQSISSSDDFDFNLKLTLAGTYRQFHTTHQTILQESLKEVLDQLRSQGKKLIVTFRNELVSLTESPASLKLGPGDILNAIEVSDTSSSLALPAHPDEIGVTLQDGNRKHTKEFRIIKTEPTLRLKELYAKQFDVNPISRIKLVFDGDVVEEECTFEELEIEDGCVIDVMVM